MSERFDFLIELCKLLVQTYDARSLIGEAKIEQLYNTVEHYTQMYQHFPELRMNVVKCIAQIHISRISLKNIQKESHVDLRAFLV